jgi:hypothetical protein
MMAKYRLLVAHELETQDGSQRAYLDGDKETFGLGEDRGAVVGDGTPYKVRWPTLYMKALDAEAEATLEKEKERLEINQAALNPIEALPINPDEYEQRYIPGLEGIHRRPPKPDGAAVGVHLSALAPVEPSREAAVSPDTVTPPPPLYKKSSDPAAPMPVAAQPPPVPGLTDKQAKRKASQEAWAARRRETWARPAAPPDMPAKRPPGEAHQARSSSMLAGAGNLPPPPPPPRPGGFVGKERVEVRLKDEIAGVWAWHEAGHSPHAIGKALKARGIQADGNTVRTLLARTAKP